MTHFASVVSIVRPSLAHAAAVRAAPVLTTIDSSALVDLAHREANRQGVKHTAQRHRQRQTLREAE